MTNATSRAANLQNLFQLMVHPRGIEIDSAWSTVSPAGNDVNGCASARAVAVQS